MIVPTCAKVMLLAVVMQGSCSPHVADEQTQAVEEADSKAMNNGQLPKIPIKLQQNESNRRNRVGDNVYDAELHDGRKVLIVKHRVSGLTFSDMSSLKDRLWAAADIAAHELPRDTLKDFDIVLLLAYDQRIHQDRRSFVAAHSPAIVTEPADILAGREERNAAGEEVRLLENPVVLEGGRWRWNLDRL